MRPFYRLIKRISIFWLPSKGAKIKPDSSKFSKIQMIFSENILLLWFYLVFVKYKGRFCDSCCFTLIKKSIIFIYNEPKFY
jgi:hypothetical protein